MSRIPARILGTVATVALALVHVASASPAEAATRPAPRATLAMELATPVGCFVDDYSGALKLDGRSTRSLRDAVAMVVDFNALVGFDLLKVSGVTDRNHDGIDDEAKRPRWPDSPRRTTIYLGATGR